MPPNKGTGKVRPSPPKTSLVQDLFRGPSESGGPVRVVLMKGMAGVGKTLQTQKFSLDWAESRSNQDVQLLFSFTFRELAALPSPRYSLAALLHRGFAESRHFGSFQNLRLLLILDGLEDWQRPLDFSRTRAISSETESAAVEELLVNLIRGDLLPTARLWITTRPAAANRIPGKYVSKVTFVHGFNEQQKEHYFRRRFSAEQASIVLSHLHRHRSLRLMSHIPIFCAIVSVVLQKVLEQTDEPELPKTLTEVYAHFLLIHNEEKNTEAVPPN